MRKRLQITVSFLLLCSSVFAQPRWSWSQLPAADTSGAIAIAQPDGNGIWSDLLRWWQGQLLAGSDTISTRAYARSADKNFSNVDLSYTENRQHDLSTYDLTLSTNANASTFFIEGSTGNIGINQSTPSASLDVNATDAIKFPSGNTSQRGTGLDGMMRYNTDSLSFEGYINGLWQPVLMGEANVGYQRVAYGDINGNISSSSALTFVEATAQLNFTASAGAPKLTMVNATTGFGSAITSANGPRWTQQGNVTGTMGIDWNLIYNTVSTNTGAGFQMDRYSRVRMGTNISTADNASNNGTTDKVGFQYYPNQQSHLSYDDDAFRFYTNDGNITLYGRNGSFGGYNYIFNTDQDTTGLDGQVLSYNGDTGEIELTASTGNNLANTNLTQSANREYDLAGYTLTFDGSGADDILVLDGSGANVGIAGTPNSNVALTVGGTEGMKHGGGTTAERPSTPSDGMERVNDDTDAVEVYVDGGWHPTMQTDHVQAIGSGGTLVVTKNMFLTIDMLAASQTLTLDPTDLQNGSKVILFVDSDNDFTLDSDTGNFIEVGVASSGTKSMTDGVYQVEWMFSNWYFFKLN